MIRPDKLEDLDEARLQEIRDLLTYESSIAFYSHRAGESMWILVSEIERCRRDHPSPSSRRARAAAERHGAPRFCAVGTSVYPRVIPPLPWRVRTRLCRDRYVDSVAIWLCDHGHTDSAIRLWKLFGLWS